jgi:hypothetical protein
MLSVAREYTLLPPKQIHEDSFVIVIVPCGISNTPFRCSCVHVPASLLQMLRVCWQHEP